MNIRFHATETVEMPVNEESIPIQHYLRQPQRLVSAIANPKLTQQLSEERFRVKMRPIDFMMYHFQPAVTLKVWSNANGTVHLVSEDCEIQGIEYINDRFSLSVKGKLFPCYRNDKTYLQGRVNAEINVELPPVLQLTPRSLLETTGNGLLKSILQRIKSRLSHHLLADYHQWATNNHSSNISTESPAFGAAENLIG